MCLGAGGEASIPIFSYFQETDFQLQSVKSPMLHNFHILKNKK